MKRNEIKTERLVRLKRMHAAALGLYMKKRVLGYDGVVQKLRLRRIEIEIKKYE